MTTAPPDFTTTSRFVITNGMRLHYHEVGPAGGDGAGTPVVLLHGGGPGASAWSNFGPNLPVFASRFRTFLLPASDYVIDDVWDTVGLRGTGSNDIVVDGVFVPE
ncbi:MAG: hypothetical protein ACHQCE_07375, partial [Streptosporangiales bacterium]